MEYFRRCLIEIFGILDEYEVGTDGQKTLLGPLAEPVKQEGADLKLEDQSDPEPEPTERVPTERELGPNGPKEETEDVELSSEVRPKQASRYDRFPVKVEEKDAVEDQVEDRTQLLGLGRDFTSGLLHWKAGGGDSTAHIQTYIDMKRTETNDADPSKDSDEDHKEDQTHVAGEDAEWREFPKREEHLEDEPLCWDEAPLSTAEDWQDELAKRCVCISNIVRGLSFVPGNDGDMARHPGLVLILGKLVLLHHEHSRRKRTPPTYQHEEGRSLACSKDEWWWDCLGALHENTLVTLANIAGHMDLSVYPESICLPILDGLLHWMVCPSAQAQDPFCPVGGSSSLTPQRLVLECLCKLSIQDCNVDLLLATPPFSRQERLFATLVRLVGERKSQMCREMAVAVLANLAQGSGTAARVIALQKGSVGALVGFLEDSLAMAQYQSPHGVLHAGHPGHTEPPSVNMMCRAARALMAIAQVDENRPEFVLYESRLLDVTLSSALSSAVAAVLCEVLFRLGRS